MTTVNLYGEDGLSVYLTEEHDICDRDDEDCAIQVIGHRLYANTLEGAHRSIRDAYLNRLSEVSQ